MRGTVEKNQSINQFPIFKPINQALGAFNLFLCLVGVFVYRCLSATPLSNSVYCPGSGLSFIIFNPLSSLS